MNKKFAKISKVKYERSGIQNQISNIFPVVT